MKFNLENLCSKWFEDIRPDRLKISSLAPFKLEGLSIKDDYEKDIQDAVTEFEEGLIDWAVYRYNSAYYLYRADSNTFGLINIEYQNGVRSGYSIKHSFFVGTGEQDSLKEYYDMLLSGNFRAVELTELESDSVDYDIVHIFKSKYKKHYVHSFTVLPSLINSFERCPKTGSLLVNRPWVYNGTLTSDIEGLKGLVVHIGICSERIYKCTECGKKEYSEEEQTEGAYICKTCVERFVTCPDCGKLYDNADYLACPHCSGNVDFKIHSWDFEPSFDFNDDGENNPLYLGVEIEVDITDENKMIGYSSDDYDWSSSDYHSKYGSHALNLISGKKEGLVYAMKDGSLDNGFEIASHPTTLKRHTSDFNYAEGFKFLSASGYRAHNTKTCGIHVHMNRNFFGNFPKRQEFNGAKMVYLIEKFSDEFNKIARRGDVHWASKKDFAQDYEDGMSEENVVEMFKDKYDGEKYVALNTSHSATFELRIFKSTLKYETYIATLQFVDNLARLVKTLDLKGIQNAKFEDIINFKEYDELSNYWTERSNA